MPLYIDTTNTTGLTLATIIDKIQTTGVDTDPALRYSFVDGQFMETESLTLADALVPLAESLTIQGYYSVTIATIDVLVEMLRISIYDSVNNITLGTLNSIPVENFVAPAVTIDLTVTEDRN